MTFTLVNGAFFIGGLIVGGFIVHYFLKKQLQQLGDMINNHDKRDPADWWKEQEKEEE